MYWNCTLYRFTFSIWACKEIGRGWGVWCFVRLAWKGRQTNEKKKILCSKNYQLTNKQMNGNNIDRVEGICFFPSYIYKYVWINNNDSDVPLIKQSSILANWSVSILVLICWNYVCTTMLYSRWLFIHAECSNEHNKFYKWILIFSIVQYPL